MFFVGYRSSADLSLTTPIDFCCNCGSPKHLDLVETPLQKTRFFLFFGTELTLKETFPYCRQCKGTAKRVRLGWMGKLLAACLMTSIAFLVLVFMAPRLPAVVGDNLFASSVVAAIVLTVLYFYIQEWSRKGRTYYQPVSLVDVAVAGDELQELKLKFFNPVYARVFTRANSELIRAGVLKVVVRE